MLKPNAKWTEISPINLAIFDHWLARKCWSLFFFYWLREINFLSFTYSPPVPPEMPFSDHLSMITSTLEKMGNGFSSGWY